MRWHGALLGLALASLPRRTQLVVVSLTSLLQGELVEVSKSICSRKADRLVVGSTAQDETSHHPAQVLEKLLFTKVMVARDADLRDGGSTGSGATAWQLGPNPLAHELVQGWVLPQAELLQDLPSPAPSRDQRAVKVRAPAPARCQLLCPAQGHLSAAPDPAQQLWQGESRA